MQLYRIQSRIDTINDKISNMDKYCEHQELSIANRDTILAALESSLRTETDNLEKCKAAHTTIVCDEDIWKFIRKARRFGYIKEIDREVLEELVDKIYISKKDTSSCFQQNRITIKFKHIGVLTTAPLVRKEEIVSVM